MGKCMSTKTYDELKTPQSNTQSKTPQSKTPQSKTISTQESKSEETVKLIKPQLFSGRSSGGCYSVEHIRARILQLITQHEPDKTDSVDIFLKKWTSKENDLLKALCAKYNEPYETMNPISVGKVYKIGSKLESSLFATVRKAKHYKHGDGFAVKIITKKQLDKDDLLSLENEVNILRQISHENIIKLYDVFYSKTKLMLITDIFCYDGKELFDHIIEKSHFSEKDATMIFKQSCQALQYIHDKSIVHRNINPENFIISDGSLKLIDFEMAASCKNSALNAPCGTPSYVAPEIIGKLPYGVQADMWSIGVVLYIMLCGFPPFYDKNDDLGRMYRKIKRAEYDMPSPYWDNIGTNAKKLIRKLLLPNPDLRLTATQALQHPWCSTSTADDTHLGDDQMFHLKRFQYIRRLRRGVRCVLAVLKLIEALQDPSNELQNPSNELQDPSNELQVEKKYGEPKFIYNVNKEIEQTPKQAIESNKYYIYNDPPKTDEFDYVVSWTSPLDKIGVDITLTGTKITRCFSDFAKRNIIPGSIFIQINNNPIPVEKNMTLDVLDTYLTPAKSNAPSFMVFRCLNKLKREGVHIQDPSNEQKTLL